MKNEELEVNNGLPTGWAYAGLEDISDVDRHSIKRGPFGSALKKAFFVPDGYKVYEQGNVINNDFDRGTYFINNEKFEDLKSFSIKPKDILMSCAGTVGKLAIVPDGVQEGVINQALLKLSVHPDMDLQYFFKLFTYQIDEILKSNLRGSAMMNLTSVKDLKLVKFPIAPLNEQKRIVAKIEKLFSNLDNSDKYLFHLEKQLKRYRQSVLKSAFKGELTKDWREKQTNLETADELVENIQKEREEQYKKQLENWEQSIVEWEASAKASTKPRKPSEHTEIPKLDKIKIQELPNIPMNWKWVKNNELIYYVTSGSRDWKKYYSEQGSKFVRTQDIKTNKLDINSAAYVLLPENVEGKRSLIEKNDMLMTITGANVGKVALIDFDIEEAYVSQSVALMKYVNKSITKYIHLYFQANQFGKTFIENSVYGMGRPVLSLDNMREVPVALCSIQEQNEIVKQIEKHFSIIDKLELNVQQSIKESKRLRQSILKQAFEGKLVEQDPNDESASVLLEKIAKAKEEYQKAQKKQARKK